GGIIPGFAKQRVCDELQRETITLSRVECSSSTGLNSELKMMEIPVQELVLGDMIFLSAGDAVPADVRIIYADDLLVNESVLKGNEESIE
ncbi:magnesium transporter, partial [Klebsiella pneumoniae]|nr:magnesium transporter [Klebsiella pneumoniae]